VVIYLTKLQLKKHGIMNLDLWNRMSTYRNFLVLLHGLE